MNIRYFESLLHIVELGSIAKAARVQNLTPAAVGQRIIALEKHFNTPLLNRSQHKAVATRACVDLLPRIRGLVKGFHDLSDQIDPSGLEGKFHIGAISTALTGLLPSAVHQLAEQAPRLNLQIRPGTSNSLFNDLQEGSIDAAIIAAPPYEVPRRFQVNILRSEPLVLLSHHQTQHSIRDQLQQDRYICYDSQSWGGLKANQYLKDNNIDIEPYYELDALEAIEKLVKQNMGVSLVPLWSGLDTLDTDLKTTEINNSLYHRNIILVTPATSKRPRIVSALLASLTIID
ncbi:MAG: DNA-binding transcriptional LysR family regulator [Gammaproteobacteria bacterium]|jgi:DNA-binding transcriptional LysR family regulator